MAPPRGRGRPRGSTRAASRSSMTPAPAGGDNDNAASPAADPTLRRTPGTVRMSPGPSMYSSSYGSPAVLPSSRSLVTGRSAVSTLGNALQSVQAANQQDRATRERADNKRVAPQKTASSRAKAAAPDADELGDDGDGGFIVDGNDDVDDSQSMPPPPRPTATAPDLSKRAASTQPGSLAGTARVQQANRLGSEPPSDNRSFIEENEVYRGAKFSTPRSTRVSASPAPPSGTRSSARIAAKNSVARQSSVEMSPNRGRGSTSAARPIASDSIDDQDSEDPLNTPKRRGLREQSSQPPNSDASREWTRPESLQRETESRDPESPSPSSRRPRSSGTTSSSGRTPNLKERVRLAGVACDDDDDDESSEESDESDGEPTPRAKRVLFPRAPRQNGDDKRPNLVRDARSGDLALPRPDRPGTQPNPFRPFGRSQPEQSVNAAADASFASSSRLSDRAKSPMVDSPRRQPSSQPQSQPQLQNQLYPRLPSQPQPPAQSGPSLLQSPPRRLIIQSRPERPLTAPPADRSSSGAKAPQPIDNALSNPPVARERRDNDNADSARQQSEPVNPAPNASGAVPQEPAPETSQFGFLIDFARGTKYEDMLNRVLKWSWIILKIWAVLAVASILYFIFIDTMIPIKRWDGISVHRDFNNGGVASWRQRFLQIVPWIVLHPFSVLTGNLDYADYRKVLHGFDMSIQNHEAHISSISAATWQMRRVLPDLIKVNIKSSTGEWAVDDEFWNALDAEMHEGGLMYSLLTLDKSDDSTYSISDTHWGAIKQRIQRDDMLSDRPATEGDPLVLSDQVIEYVNQHTSKVWADWLKSNQDAINRLQGQQPGQVPSRTYQELYGDLEGAMNKRLKALGLEQGVVTRDEFMAKLEESVANHENEINTELKNLNSKLGQALGIALEAKAAADAPIGVPREDVEEMIDQAMRRAISDAVLEAIAKGHLKAHFNEEVVHKKNYFNGRRGAIIDTKTTSTTYHWAAREDTEYQSESTGSWFSLGKKKPKVVFHKGGETMGQPYAPELALEKWGEDGECWCAGLADDKNVSSSTSAPADLGIFTAESVIPQYLVVEHIDAGASFDPKSTPRDIEFWIRAPQDKRARTLDHWSKERWPAIKYDAASRRLLDKGYAKIGQFVYDNTLGNGESQLFHFSRELVDMDAQTLQVVVRATTNYGAKDHTCFYRLRLFGEDPAGAKLTGY